MRIGFESDSDTERVQRTGQSTESGFRTGREPEIGQKRVDVGRSAVGQERSQDVAVGGARDEHADEHAEDGEDGEALQVAERQHR